MNVSPLAGKPPEQNIPISTARLVSASYTGIPGAMVPGEEVAFGTSVNRGSFSFYTDRDPHSILTKSAGLLHPDRYLQVAILFLLQNQALLAKTSAVGKTVNTRQLIDCIAAKPNRKMCNVHVESKRFDVGLPGGSLCFGAGESAGVSFPGLNVSVWTIDKNRFIHPLLSAGFAATIGMDPGKLYINPTKEYVEPFYDRLEAKATPGQKEKLKNLSSTEIKHKELADENMDSILIKAPGNNTPIGGVKVVTINTWVATGPSGTEDIYEIYAESFLKKDYLKRINNEVQAIVYAPLYLN
ncbi:MAG: hypothetical protein ABI472_16010 [Ginsengibacter sp.]